MIPTIHPIELPNDAECDQMLSGMFREADIPRNWPVTTETVAELLRQGGGFDAPADMLDTMARSGQLGRIVERDGRIEWGPQNVSLAVSICNASRRWIPGDRRHLGKWSGLEVLEQQARAAGGTIFTDTDAVDLQTMIGVLKGAADNELRMAMCLGLEAKLRQAGVLS